jgi:type III secretion protein Q
VSVRPYPWSSLEQVPRRALRRLTEVREHPASFVPDEVAGVLAALVGARIEIVPAGLSLGAPARRLAEIGLAWGESRVTLGAEPALVAALLERLLARPFALARAGTELEPSVAGAFAALCVEVARRVASDPVTLAPALDVDAETLCVRLRVAFEDRAYAAYALVAVGPAPTREAARPDLATLGDLPLAVPVVVAVALASRDELRRLTPGAAFVPGLECWVDAAGAGRGALVAATGERGAWVDLTPDGRLVLRGDIAELSHDEAGSAAGMSEPDDVNQTLVNAALEAPVVVRVELGVVSMSAAEWARLCPGDVIETGRRVAEPVILRVAGRAVARGELVDVDGEVGVRVRELFGDKAEG